MTFDPAQHHRRSIRLKGYDYSQPGMYFVTICTHERKILFGGVRGGGMRLNKAGWAVRRAWYGLHERFPGLQFDAFVVMPNHIHGILGLFHGKGAVPLRSETRGAASSAPTSGITLGRVIRAFKSQSALEVNRLLGREGKPLWQRNYYEHIIRHGEDLADMRRYIADNPASWEEDSENPAQLSK